MNGISFNDFMLMANSNRSVAQIVLALGLACLLGTFLFYFYKRFYFGVLYSKSFNITLVMVTFVVCMVMMIIGSNLALSLGMVGALSIIRYRSAIKEPMDTGYLFWAIGNGLGCGSGSFKVILIGNIFLVATMLFFFKTKRRNRSYLLSLNGADIGLQEVLKLISSVTKNSSLKLQSHSNGVKEYIFEVNAEEKDLDLLMDKLTKEKIEQINISSFDNEAPI